MLKQIGFGFVCALAVSTTVEASLIYDQTLNIAWSGGNPAPSYVLNYLSTPEPATSGLLSFSAPQGECDVDGGTEFMTLSIEGTNFGTIVEIDPVLPSWASTSISLSQLQAFTADNQVVVTISPSGAIGLCNLFVNLNYETTPEPGIGCMVGGLLCLMLGVRRTVRPLAGAAQKASEFAASESRTLDRHAVAD